jgi:hypothetical protein
MRTKLTDLSDEKVLEELVREFSAGGLVSVQVVERLSQRPVASMAQEA